MCSDANPLEETCKVLDGYVLPDASNKQTFEIRSPDSSADIYQLMAGLCTGCRVGLEMPEDEALALVRRTYAGLNIHTKGSKDFAELPGCCTESADALEKSRAVFEQDNVFPPRMIDGIVRSLRSFNDHGLLAEAGKDPTEVKALVDRYFYCG